MTSILKGVISLTIGKLKAIRKLSQVKHLKLSFNDLGPLEVLNLHSTNLKEIEYGLQPQIY